MSEHWTYILGNPREWHRFERIPDTDTFVSVCGKYKHITDAGRFSPEPQPVFNNEGICARCRLPSPFRICDECEENQEWCECEYRDQCCNDGEHCGHDHLITDYYCCWCGEEFENG